MAEMTHAGQDHRHVVFVGCGNDFLIEAANFLRESFRRLDVVARFGKTGFAVILQSTGSTVSIVHQRLIQHSRKALAWLRGCTGN